MTTTEVQSPEVRAQKRAKYLTDLLWHIGTFVIINGFLWILDIFVGAEGVQYAFWVTLGWGIGLAFHALAWYVDGRQVEARKTLDYLADEQRRQGRVQ